MDKVGCSPCRSRLSSSLRAIAFTLAPLLVPKLITYYRGARVETVSQNVGVQKLPPTAQKSLTLLFCAAAIALLTTMPYFAPENIFALTHSRLQTSNEVLFNRLAAVRGTGLTENDIKLQPRMASLDARLLYLVYGPEVLTHCVFCNSNEPLTYFAHALPVLLLPYALNLLVIATATSTLLGGRLVNRWRMAGILVGFAVAALDCTVIISYDWRANARALRPSDYRLFFWIMRTTRGLLICVADLFLAGLLYLASTNRMFVKPPTAADRTEDALQMLDQGRAKSGALSVVRNAIVRDEQLRHRTDAYWVREGKALGEIMNEAEVVDGVRNALSGRVRISDVEAEARRFADSLVFGG